MSAHIPPCDVETNGGECCCAAVWMDRAKDAEEKLAAAYEDDHRADRLEVAMREIQKLAGEATISAETLAAFGPLTQIVIVASEALGPAPTAPSSGDKP